MGDHGHKFWFIIALLGIIAIGSATQQNPEQAQAQAATTKRDECNNEFAAVLAVENAFRYAIDATDPGLQYEAPGIGRLLSYSGADPLRYARPEGECTYRVHSFVTLSPPRYGVSTLRYSALARWDREREDWNTSNLQIAR